MARAKNGINGRISGKVGNMVFSSWNGIEVVKSAPVRTAPFSEKQLLQQWLFKHTQAWLSPLTPFLKIGFKGYSQANQGFTAAKKYLFANALIKDGYNSTIDPSLMLVSHGSLPSAENIAVELDAEKELQFSWDTSLNSEKSPLDQVMLLAYNVEEKEAAYIPGGKFRRDGGAGLSLANAKPGDYHVYLAFVAEDRSRQSNSVYLGAISNE